MKVLIVNQHTENFGDDAAGAGLITLLLESPRVSSVTVVYNGPDGVPPGDGRVDAPSGVKFRDIGALKLMAYFITPNWRLFRSAAGPLGRLRTLIRDADFVIVAPSGANIGIYRDWQYLVRLLIVVREKQRPVFHWNTVGRSGNWLFDKLSRKVLRNSRMYVRELASQRFLNGIGVSSEVGPDTAFALEPQSLPVRNDVLSLVPSELDSWHPEFRDKPVNELILGPVAQSIARFAQSNQLRVEILPHLRSAGESDFNAAMLLALKGAGMTDVTAIVRDDVTTMNSYDELLATSQLVVGGRYHSIILAAKNLRPFVALSYENKTVEASKYLQMEEYCVDLHAGDAIAGNLTEALDRALKNHVDIHERLGTAISRGIIPRIRLPLEDIGVLERQANEHVSTRADS